MREYYFFLYKNDITDKVPEINIDNNMKYQLGSIRFFRTLNVKIYGILGKPSRISYRHSSYIYGADFKYVPYEYYDLFQKELKKRSKPYYKRFYRKKTFKVTIYFFSFFYVLTSTYSLII